MEITDPPAEFHQPDSGLSIVEFGPPRGYSSGEIGTAKFLVDRQDPRYPQIHTYWKPTEQELAALADGAVMQFTMVCGQPPPVSAAVYQPERQPFQGRCDACGHWWDEHGRNGCAADDEAAMGGCDCIKAGALL